MYTFADLGQMHNDDGSLRDNTVLKTGTDGPSRDYMKRSVSVRDPFRDQKTQFLYDETYFVSSMYVMESQSDDGLENSKNFSLPTTSVNPIFIPSYLVNFRK